MKIRKHQRKEGKSWEKVPVKNGQGKVPKFVGKPRKYTLERITGFECKITVKFVP